MPNDKNASAFPPALPGRGLVAALALLAACGNQADPLIAGPAQEGTPSPDSGQTDTPSVPIPHLAGVDTAVRGTWRVLAGTYAGDTLRLTADSLVWGSPPRINMVTSLYPTSTGKRLYAARGLMGLSDGKGADKDTVRYEYERSGDTLWLEYRTAANAGFGVDKASLYAWPLLPVR